MDMKKLFLLVTTVLLALTSCTEENIVDDAACSGKIQASFEESVASRLAIGEKNALTWSAYDTFVMFNENGENSYWKMTGIPGMETGAFEGQELEGTLKGAAFPSTDYPSLSGNMLTMTLPAELTYEAGICNLPMWASFSSLEDNISFKHLGALLKINFADMPEGYHSLVLTTDKQISGVFTADLSQQEPVISPAGKGTNGVKVSFKAISGSDNDRLFYIPLPVGTYGSINVSISDGTNTLSIADWSNRTIVRKKVYVASLSYRVSDAETPTEITGELNDMMEVTSNATVDLTNKVDASEGAIVIPAESSKIALNFEQVPVTSSSAPLKFEEAAASDGSQLVVSLPASSEETYMEFNTPATTVNVEGGNYKQIVARTAANTLILGENTVVKDLIILAGNVVFEGGKVTGSITRDASNTDAVTYVFVENESELDGVTIGEGIKIVEDPKNVDYVTFTADNEQTLTLTKSVETLEYSVDGGLWTELGTTTVTFGGEKGTLRLRGKSVTGTAIATGDAARIVFGNASVPVAGSGDIRTLIDFQNYDSDELDTSKARFCNLFYNCTVLTTAPKLPATVLASECYWQMFVYCSGLIEAPELPATTLTTDCYRLMFYGCKGLQIAPELPATTLVPNCYLGMFYECTNLKYAPKRLPASELTAGCYSNMFYNCKSLVNAPELPATTLTDQCYANMFYGCTNLKEAPELPATTLVKDCYRLMFYGCSSLETAPELPATTLGAGCYMGLFYNCTNLKYAPKCLPATRLTTECYSSMFYGCTSLKTAPELPATTLAAYCYSNMFEKCSSLTKAPELPATTLANHCYSMMFANCVSLEETPELPATTLASACYMDMFMNCVSLTKAPKLPVTTLAEQCYYGMFWGCTGLSVAPELPATKMERECYTIMFGGCTGLQKAPELPGTVLAIGCYSSMFSDCTGLTRAPELPVVTLADGCYQNMFERCTGLTEAPKLPATVMKSSCYSGMFSGCTNLTSTPELPATVLAGWCYYNMFSYCTNLNKASILPAKTLEDKCYMIMFRGCVNLNNVTMLATDVSADMCLESWLDQTASVGTFYKDSSVSDVSSYGVPEGWEVKDY